MMGGGGVLVTVDVEEGRVRVGGGGECVCADQSAAKAGVVGSILH